jgi:hypothetical protein
VHHKTFDVVFGVGVVLVVLWFVWEATPWSFHSRLFPWTIGLSVLVLALVQVGASLRNSEHRSSQAAEVSEFYSQDLQANDTDKPPAAGGLVSICIWIGLFCGGIWLLGFRLGSLILTVAFLKFAGSEDYKRCLGLGLINYLFFLIVFDLTLGVPLFDGALAQWLGIEALDKFVVKNLVPPWG